MPQLKDLRARSFTQEPSLPISGDEVMVSDVRGNLTPAEMVEMKVRALLGRSAEASTAHDATPRGPHVRPRPK